MLSQPHPHVRHLDALLVITVALFVVVSVIHQIASALPYTINATESLPLGLYHVEPIRRPVHPGDTVVACMPPEAARFAIEHRFHVMQITNNPSPCPGGVVPVIKKVIAIGGDSVVITPRGVYVNTRLVPHSVPLKTAPSGALMSWAHNQIVPDGSVFLWTPVRTSYDSRYWGPVVPFAFANPVLTWQ